MSFGGRGGFGGAANDEQMMMQQMGMRMVMGINGLCFKECISSFREDQLTAKEQTCIKNCAHRQAQGMNSMQEIQG